MRGRRPITTLWASLLALALPGASICAAQSPATTLFDHDMSPAAGASATVTIGRTVARTEDAFVPLRLFADRDLLRRSSNAGYRLAKLTLFDGPQENWLRVANHEIFGHGGRLRELFSGRIAYALPAPPPYGRGGGATAFGFGRDPTVEEVLAVTVGGMEANRMMARILTQDALTAGRWHYRDSLRYVYAEVDTIHYILGTSDNGEEAGNDVGDFLLVYNDAAAPVGEKTLTARTLRRRVLAGFANPMLAYSFYSTFVSYVWRGHADAPTPMLHLGATRYLPLARFQLTPFGTEWVIDNAFVRNGRYLDASIRAGHTIGARTWGVGVEATRLAEWNRWTFDGDVNLWRQPEWGGDVSATAHRRVRDLNRIHQALSLVVQGGYKTNGFLAGERIHQGGTLRIGVSLTK